VQVVAKIWGVRVVNKVWRNVIGVERYAASSSWQVFAENLKSLVRKREEVLKRSCIRNNGFHMFLFLYTKYY
jgi:hypothetical protein